MSDEALQLTTDNSVPVLTEVVGIPTIPTREQICALERELLKFPQQSIPPEHFFAQGLYARRIDIPAGTTLTGKVHRYEHFNFVYGDITVWTEDGMKRLTGFHMLMSRPGTKRAGYTHADTTWITVHATDLRDPDDCELALTEPEHIVLEGDTPPELT